MSLSFGPDWKGSGDIWGEGGQDPWRKKNKRRRRVTFLEHWCGGLYRLVSTAVTKHILRVHSEFIFPIRQKPKRALTHLLCVVLHRFFYIKKKIPPCLGRFSFTVQDFHFHLLKSEFYTCTGWLCDITTSLEVSLRSSRRSKPLLCGNLRLPARIHRGWTLLWSRRRLLSGS